MGRKTILILLVVLSIFIIISGTKGDDGWIGGRITGWIGKYLEIMDISAFPYDARVNETVNFEFSIQIWKDMFIKVIEIGVHGADITYNKTLAKDMYIEIPPNALTNGIYELVEVTSTVSTPLHCYVYAKYEYEEGNQTLEQEGTMYVYTIATVKHRTYSDLWDSDYYLTREIEDLETSRSRLQELTYLLTFATSAFVVTTCVFLATTIYFARRKSKGHE